MWTWLCPTCGDSGTVEQKPTFSRCYKCDSTWGDKPPLRIIQNNLQQLVDHAHEVAIIEAITIIEEEMEKTSPHTGHGKAQRVFGRKLLERLAKEK